MTPVPAPGRRRLRLSLGLLAAWIRGERFCARRTTIPPDLRIVDCRAVNTLEGWIEFEAESSLWAPLAMAPGVQLPLVAIVERPVEVGGDCKRSPDYQPWIGPDGDPPRLDAGEPAAGGGEG